MIIQASGNSAAAIGYWVRTAAEDAQDQGNMVCTTAPLRRSYPVRLDEDTMTISYYGNSAAEQLNASGRRVRHTDSVRRPAHENYTDNPLTATAPIRRFRAAGESNSRRLRTVA